MPPPIQKPDRRRLGLRWRMVILLAVAAALLTADRAREIVLRRAELIAASRERLQTTARIGADRQADMISEARALLTLAVEMPESGPRSETACQQPYTRTVDAIGWLGSLVSLGLDGRVICSSGQAIRTISVADRPYFRTAIATRAFTLSEFMRLRSDQKLGLVAAMPRIVGDAIESVVIARIDIEWVDALVARLGHDSYTTVVLSDASGMIVSIHPADPRMVGRKLSTIGLPEGSGPRESMLDIVDPSGVARIFASAQLPHTGGRIFVGAERDAVLAPVQHEIATAVGKLGAVLVVLIGMLWLGVRRLVVTPTRALAAVATRLGTGDLGARADETSAPAEFAGLGRAFNAMADQLSLRDQELRAVNEHLAQLATVDALTGLANRRLFDERLAQEWRRAGRDRRPIGLVMIDVDRFKAYNDTYGHPAGDVCLARIGRAVASGLRPGDLAARMGGEEFALLLPGADVHRTLHAARLLRLEIESLGLSHSGNARGVVTISAGVATAIPGREAPSSEFLREADEALYRAKRSGRNRVAGPGEADALAS